MTGQCRKSLQQINLNESKTHPILMKIHKKYNEESDEGYFREVDVEYFEKIGELHHDLPFLPERIKIKKFEKLVANLLDKTEYVIHIRNLKQALNNGLILKKIHRVI